MAKQSKAVTTSIKATSRVALKIRDNFYTIEFTEERSVPEDADMDFERTALWDDVNKTVDDQCEEIVKAFK